MRFAQFQPLETDHLHLRELRMEDIQEYYEDLFSDGKVCRYLLVEPHQDIGESLSSIQSILDGYEAGGCYCWAIASRREDTLLGLIRLTHIREEDSSCSFVYLLAEKCWNRGYGTEAVKAVIDFAFDSLEMERVWADHMVENPASGAVMQKAGMTYIGTVPGKHEKMGLHHDAKVYEIRRPQREELTANAYQKLAMTTLNPDLDKREMLTNAVMGLCGEAGETIDLVKKHLYQGHSLDRSALAGELGDIAWYLAEAACALDLSLEDILRANLEKLRKRYPSGFSEEQSVNR